MMPLDQHAPVGVTVIRLLGCNSTDTDLTSNAAASDGADSERWDFGG